MITSSIVLVTHCLTQAATGEMKPGSLTIFSIGVCIKVCNCDQRLKLWLSVSSRTPRWTSSVTTLSTNEEAGILHVVGGCKVPCDEDVIAGFSDQSSKNVSHFLSLDGLNDIFYFYLDQRPQLLPTYLDDRGVYPHGHVTNLIYAVTSMVIFMGQFIQCGHPSVWVCCVCSSVGMTDSR